MTEYTMKQDKNGKTRYYRVEDGKKTAIKKAEYEANGVTAAKKSTGFKQSHWTKVHEPGQGNFESKNNVIDITVGKGRAQADVLYSTRMIRTFEKAAYWLLHSLEVARANDAVALAGDSIREKAAAAARDDEQVVVEGEGWSCTIENMGDGEFKAQMTWTFKADEDPQMTLDLNPGEVEVA